MRLAKPRSLSYQAQTFTSVPSDARVRPASRMALAGWWLKSEDTSEPLVSSDFNHHPASAILDAGLTRASEGTLVKVCAWYDNERGFANRMLDATVALMNAK